jgi:membrane protease YdiL (CAAX protease family)
METIIRHLNDKKNISYGLYAGLILSVLNFPFQIFFKGFVPYDYYAAPHNGIVKFIAFLLVAIVIGPLVEELIFRVFLYRKIKTKFGIVWGYIGSAGLFTLAHAIESHKGIIKIALTALLLAYVYEKTDSIKSIVIAHSFLNLTWFTAYYCAIIAI